LRFVVLSSLFLVTGCTLEFDPALLDEANCACSDGVSCFPGNSPQACGKNGGSCQQCNAPLSACLNGACSVENAVVTSSLASSHTGAVDRLGGLWLWGSNQSGGIAQPEASVTEQQTPLRVQVAGVDAWASVATGGVTPALFGCAIAKPGALYCWGNNGDGQTGLGSNDPGSTPTQVEGSDWSAVGTGSAYACGIRAGKLYCWGYASTNHRLGLASEPADPRTPQEVPGSQSWQKLSVGDGHACAIREDQSLWCWGDYEAGQLGHAVSDVPLQVDGGTSFVQVSANGEHTCGLRANRSLWCWGGNSRGELGISQSAPAPLEVEPGSEWLSVAAGGRHTCGVRSNGKLFCWGANDYGQLGLGTFDDAGVPMEVPDPGPWTSVDAGDQYSCGVKEDGTFHCWGANGNSQLGIDDPTFQPAPSPQNVLLED
jgi:alpha-tubulin suppressor-like RCC1 family protein